MGGRNLIYLSQDYQVDFVPFMGMNISLIWMQNVSSHKLSKMYIVKYYNKYELNDEYLKKKWMSSAWKIVQMVFTEIQKTPVPVVISFIVPSLVGNQVNPRLTLLCTQVRPVHLVAGKKGEDLVVQQRRIPVRHATRSTVTKRSVDVSRHTRSYGVCASFGSVRLNEVDSPP